MRQHFFLIFIASFFTGCFLISCEPTEQKFTFDTSAKLRFSQDTVLFDTVFTSIGSITKRFSVFNDGLNAVNILSIQLNNSSSSDFTISVNGEQGRSFENIRLLGEDSMLVLVEVHIDPMDENLPFIVEDSILFQTNGNLQVINLVAWGQDANFLSDSVLVCQSIWTSDRPYVIYNSVLVDSLCTLTIEPGTKIYSHFGSSIFIKGRIEVNGRPDNRVIFSNDRFDVNFLNAPGQWQGLFFLEGSKDNRIEYADIRNADYGVWLGTPDNDTIPDLELNGVIVENMARTGLIAFSSDLTVTNTLVNNCLEFAVGNFAGGNYKYQQCTFANFSFIFFRENPLFVLSDNLILSDQSVLVGDVKLEMENTIIWGDFPDELILNNEGGADFESNIAYSILKTTDLNYDINNNLINADPLFINPFEHNYRIDSLSPAINAGTDLSIFLDITGAARDSLPDIGAYEWIPGNQ